MAGTQNKHENQTEEKPDLLRSTGTGQGRNQTSKMEDMIQRSLIEKEKDRRFRENRYPRKRR